MGKFRKKPVVIEALHYNGDPDTVRGWLMQPEDYLVNDGELYIKTLEGPLHASRGDWIIQGVAGEFYPCRSDIFEQTYEPVFEVEGAGIQLP